MGSGQFIFVNFKIVLDFFELIVDTIDMKHDETTIKEITMNKQKQIKNKAGVPKYYWDGLSDYDKRAINATKGITIAAEKLAKNLQARSENDPKVLSMGWIESYEGAIRKINAMTRAANQNAASDLLEACKRTLDRLKEMPKLKTKTGRAAINHIMAIQMFQIANAEVNVNTSENTVSP